MVCKRCSAECTCKKVKRKPRAKPRYGRGARNVPVATPPVPQQLFFGYTPQKKEQEQLVISTSAVNARPEGAPRLPYASQERAMMGAEDVRSRTVENLARAYERGERQGELAGMRYGEVAGYERAMGLQIPRSKGRTQTVAELLRRVEEGRTVATYPATRTPTPRLERGASGGGGGAGGEGSE